METDAYYLLLTHVELGRFVLVTSPVHLTEVGGIKDPSEREEVLQLMKRVGSAAVCSSAETRKRADELVGLRCGIADAAHVAYAEATADMLITCDTRLLKQCRRHRVRIPAYNPVEFATLEGLQ